MIRIVEVGPRDGLQNETAPVPTAAKIDFVDALQSMGEPVGVDRRKLENARRLLDPFVKDERREMPETDLPACAYCEYATGEVCCKRREAADGAV